MYRLLILLAVAVTGIICARFGCEKPYPPIRTALISVKDGRLLTAAGFAGQVVTGRSLPIRTPTRGYISLIYVREGDIVAAGQLLLKFDADWHLPSGEFARQFLVAPRAGLVTGLTVTAGNLVYPGKQVATLHELAQLRILIELPAGHPQRVRCGTPMVVSVSELPARQFTGWIEQVSAPGAGGRWRVYVAVKNTTRPYLLPGMHARVQWSASQPGPASDLVACF